MFNAVSTLVFRCSVVLTLAFLLSLTALAQDRKSPLTSQELVQMIYLIPRRPEKKDEIIQAIRERGIGFPLTDGLRSLVATKSGSDALLRRTLEEAERRRANPTATPSLPPEEEANALLARTKAATFVATDAMPDFVVRQEITRAIAYGTTSNWLPQDRLTVAVGYRAEAGEDYKLLAINGVPMAAEDSKQGSNYSDKVGGTTSTGEYVTMLVELFKDDTQAEFKAVDTDTLRGRPTIVYEFEVKKEFSKQQLKAKGIVDDSTISGYTGRIWVDRELNRVLRLEDTATEIPVGFPITAANSVIDYGWVTINEKQHLLPSRAEIKLTATLGGAPPRGRVLGPQQTRRVDSIQSRNVIRFRDYQKYGTEVKIIEDVEPDEPEPAKP
jgi:hypothetical protein